MKKVTTIIGAICMMGLLTFVSTSCKKNQAEGSMTIQVVVPDAEEMSFDGERAYLTAGGKFRWSKNDQVRVYNLCSNPAKSKTSIFHKVGGPDGVTNTNNDQTAYFTGPSVGSVQDLQYRLFYPYNMVYGTEEEIEDQLTTDNHQTFVVSRTQDFCFFETDQHKTSLIDPAAMPMATKVANLNGPATLHHMFGFLKFGISVDPDEPNDIVVDSIKFVDNDLIVRGKVTLNLANVDTDELNAVSDAFFTTYHGMTPEFISGPLATEYGILDWYPEPAVDGYSITMNCIYKQEGVDRGRTISKGSYDYFTFVLRPLACYNGFSLVMYIHNDADPSTPKEVTISRWAGNLAGTPGMACTDDYANPNYMWGMAPRMIKTFLFTQPLTVDMLD